METNSGPLMPFVPLCCFFNFALLTKINVFLKIPNRKCHLLNAFLLQIYLSAKKTKDGRIAIADIYLLYIYQRGAIPSPILSASRKGDGIKFSAPHLVTSPSRDDNGQSCPLGSNSKSCGGWIVGREAVGKETIH